MVRTPRVLFVCMRRELPGDFLATVLSRFLLVFSLNSPGSACSDCARPLGITLRRWFCAACVCRVDVCTGRFREAAWRPSGNCVVSGSRSSGRRPIVPVSHGSSYGVCVRATDGSFVLSLFCRACVGSFRETSWLLIRNYNVSCSCGRLPLRVAPVQPPRIILEYCVRHCWCFVIVRSWFLVCAGSFRETSWPLRGSYRFLLWS